MQEELNQKVKTNLLELLAHMGFSASIFERVEEGCVVYNIKTTDAQILIGKQGANLEALQYIVHTMFRKQIRDERFSFALDVDDYKDNRTIYLKDLARKAAHHVRENKRAVMLEPMPAYERRVIHNYLSLYNDVASESSGLEPERRVIIRLQKRTPSPAGDDFGFIENS